MVWEEPLSARVADRIEADVIQTNAAAVSAFEEWDSNSHLEHIVGSLS